MFYEPHARKSGMFIKAEQFLESIFFFFFFFFFFFVGPHWQHMEIPRLGGPIGAVATILHHSHSNAGCELHL